MPPALHGKPEAIVIYNNLPDILADGSSGLREDSPLEKEKLATLALKIDQAYSRTRACGWKGDDTGKSSAETRCFRSCLETAGDTSGVRNRKKSARLLMIETIKLGELSIRVTRKDVKHVHLSVHPPDGRVTLIAPSATRLDVARVYASSRLGWIRQQQSKLLSQAAKHLAFYRTRKPLPLGPEALAVHRLP